MEWLLAIFGVGLVIYSLIWLGKRSTETETSEDTALKDVQPEIKQDEQSARRAPRPSDQLSEVPSIASSSASTAGSHGLPEGAIDLRGTAERSFRIVGSSYWADQSEIRQFPLDYFILRREPENEHDENTVAVYGRTRKFGYLSRSAAKQYAPLFDELGLDFIVPRDNEHYTGDRFFLPYVPELRKLVKAMKFGAIDDQERDANRASTTKSSKTEPKPRPTLSRVKRSLTSGYPKIGGPYSNGERVYGEWGGLAKELSSKETPKVSSLQRSSITPAIQKVRIGDRLQLCTSGRTVTVLKSEKKIGHLTWKDEDGSFDGGILEVQRVFIGMDGLISNCGGIARPTVSPAS